MNDFYSQGYASALASLVQTDLAGAYVYLWQAGEITPGMNVTLAILDAAECDFSAYAKQKVTAWLGPFNVPGGGAYVDSGLVIFAAEDVDPDPFVPNMVGGYWVEDAAGVLVALGQLASEVPIAKAGDVVALSVQLPQATPPVV